MLSNEGSCELVTTALKRLKIDRVDLVPEGANSAAFVTLYKGKEMKPMTKDEIIAKLKPEHAEVIQEAIDSVAKERDEAIAQLEDVAKSEETGDVAKSEETEDVAKSEEPDDVAKEKCPECGAVFDDDCDDCGHCEHTKKATEGTASFDEDETLVKAMPAEMQEFVSRLQKQKEAAEQVAKEAIAREKHAEAVNKAADLKALPIATDALIDFIEKASDDTVDMLSAIAKGIESTVLAEQGVAVPEATFSDGKSWDKIEKLAKQYAEERGVTVAKATGMVIDEHPEMYKEYLEGGAN